MISDRVWWRGRVGFAERLPLIARPVRFLYFSLYRTCLLRVYNTGLTTDEPENKNVLSNTIGINNDDVSIWAGQMIVPRWRLDGHSDRCRRS